MIIDYDHSPSASYERKLQSLKESVQMALNEVGSGSTTIIYQRGSGGGSSKDVGGTMYDYTLNGGTALSASSSGYTRKLTVGDNSLITPDDILRMKIYGVSDTDGAVRINSYQCLYSSTDSLLVSWSQSSTRSFVFHIEAPFEITADMAYM